MMYTFEKTSEHFRNNHYEQMIDKIDNIYQRQITDTNYKHVTDLPYQTFL